MTEIAWRDEFRQSTRGHTSISLFHLFKDGHMSEMDGEASVNKCDNYHVISPCFYGLSGVTHLSVTICDGGCVRLCVSYVCTCLGVCVRTWLGDYEGESISVCAIEDIAQKWCHLTKE